MGFKENLKTELAYNDMMVKELSAQTGISRRTLDNYLRDTRASPTAENAVKIAQALGVSVEYLVTGTAAAGTPLSPDLRQIVHEAERLQPQERLVVLDLIKSLSARLHSR